ncbi:MAG: DegT/DnrJ/EryC1/StrS aminotransferase family protein [Gaiellales bacterium]|nr:MAG: DegT/DnrJ/EryC1/StrS aminotransferase family protein [Gaiellales bacterium]
MASRGLHGLPAAEEYIPFHRPILGDEEERAVLEVLRSGWLTRGEVTADFERMFAAHVGSHHAVGLNSCSAALHLALLAAGVGAGDEVITTPYTFAATANTIIHTGARPVFADIDPASLNIDPEEIAARITERTKAVIPVHFGGIPCDMDRIGSLATEYGLTVIEDAAHALGASYGGKMIGSISPFTAFSFYATKNITTGEGGMLTTNDSELADMVRVLSLHGMSSDAWKRYSREGHSYYEVVVPGFKYNMFDIQAAIGCVQLGRESQMRERRSEIAAMYGSMLAGLPLARIDGSRDDREPAHHLYVVVLDLDSLSVSRDQVAQAMESLNVGVSVHFRSLHLHPYYRETFGFAPGDFPNALKAADAALSLPIYPSMSDDDAAVAATVLKSVLERFSS